MSNVKKIHADYKKLALDRGFEYDNDTIPKNAGTVTEGWKCVQKHPFKACYSSIQAGQGCPHCYGNFPKNHEDYKILALSRGFTYDNDTIPKSTRIPTDGWKCGQKHPFKACYNSIQQGCGCTYCYGHGPKNHADYVKLALDHGFEYDNDTIPANTDTPTEGWKCKENHSWKARYHDIQHGYGCPHCAKKFPKNHKDYIQLALDKGFIYDNDDIPKSVDIPTDGWKCKYIHPWKACYSSIRNGSGCPTCGGYRSEELCRKYFEEALLEPFPKVRPEWLRYKKGSNLELDGYNEELQIAFEYQGKQHYEEIEHFHRAEGAFEYQQEKDNWKREQCKKINITLIEIPYTYSYLNPNELRNFIYDSLFYSS